jgi:hypothetical protein
MKWIFYCIMLFAGPFQSSAQTGSIWFCSVDSLDSGHVNVRWRAIFPASSGLKPSLGAKCVLTLESNSDLARGRQPLLHPDYRVLAAPNLPGFVLEISQAFNRSNDKRSRRSVHGTMTYQCSRNGNPPASCEQAVAFNIQ